MGVIVGCDYYAPPEQLICSTTGTVSANTERCVDGNTRMSTTSSQRRSFRCMCLPTAVVSNKLVSKVRPRELSQVLHVHIIYDLRTWYTVL